MIGFGAIATSSGILILLKSALGALQLGLILAALGIYLKLQRGRVWGLLASILLLLGTIITAGGIITITRGSPTGFLIITFLGLIGAILAKSGLLSMFSALALSATIGAFTAYGFASYYLVIQQPSLTIILFTILGILSYQISKKVRPDYEDVGIIFARTCLFMVNFGFWVGSLWGDTLGKPRSGWQLTITEGIPDLVFVIGWAIALILAAMWAIKAHKRWVVNTVMVFGAIHFYTQYFERLGANSLSLMLGGIIALAIALGIVKYNNA